MRTRTAIALSAGAWLLCQAVLVGICLPSLDDGASALEVAGVVCAGVGVLLATASLVGLVVLARRSR